MGHSPHGLHVTDHWFKTHPKSNSHGCFSRVQSAVAKSCEIQSIYPSLRSKLILSMCGNPADVGNHMGSFAILRISVTSYMCAPLRVGMYGKAILYYRIRPIMRTCPN